MIVTCGLAGISVVVIVTVSDTTTPSSFMAAATTVYATPSLRSFTVTGTVVLGSTAVPCSRIASPAGAAPSTQRYATASAFSDVTVNVTDEVVTSPALTDTVAALVCSSCWAGSQAANITDATAKRIRIFFIFSS